MADRELELEVELQFSLVNCHALYGGFLPKQEELIEALDLEDCGSQRLGQKQSLKHAATITFGLRSNEDGETGSGVK